MTIVFCLAGNSETNNSNPQRGVFRVYSRLFAAMHVPEVWRHDGQQLKMFRLIDGVYQTIASSRELPGLATDMIVPFLNRRFEVGETSLIHELRQSIG